MKSRIAIIEDERPITDLYRRKFENGGFEVAVAGSGEEGIVVIEQHRPHVVLLDLLMPDMDGFQLLDELSRRKLDQPKVIILTNVPDEINKHRAAEYGITDFFVKVQVTPTQIAERVAQLLAD